MEADSVYVMMCINIHVCLPFTLIVVSLCCAVRLDGAPVTFYINLLISNLVQLGATVALMVTRNHNCFNPEALIVLGCGASASLCFRTIIALERYFLICRPKLDFIRQMKTSVMFCVLIWIFCVVVFPLFVIFRQFVFFLLFAFIPAPVFILCLARTIKSLPAATTVPAEERRRIVGSLVLLLVLYVLTILPVSHTVVSPYFNSTFNQISITLFHLSPFMDLILFPLLCKGSIDKMLRCFCCCRKGSTEGNGSSRL